MQFKANKNTWAAVTACWSEMHGLYGAVVGGALPVLTTDDGTLTAHKNKSLGWDSHEQCYTRRGYTCANAMLSHDGSSSPAEARGLLKNRSLLHHCSAMVARAFDTNSPSGANGVIMAANKHETVCGGRGEKVCVRVSISILRVQQAGADQEEILRAKRTHQVQVRT